jgi:phosphoheptose isomerase
MYIYHEGYKYLGISDYEPNEVFIQLFKDLAKKDDEFIGIIVNIPNEKKIIDKEELEKL